MNRSLRQRQGVAAWRTTAGSQIETPLRFVRSIQLEVLEVRRQRTNISSRSTSSSLQALAGMALSPTQAHAAAYNPILEIKRTASIASGSSATGTERGSEDAASVYATSPLPPTVPSLPMVNAHVMTIAPSHVLRKSSADGKVDKDNDQDKKERDSSALFCEISLDAEIVARTSVHKAGSTVPFYESFNFSNLPPFAAPLSLYIHSIKRNQQTLVGRVKIPLREGRKNTRFQEWWHVASPSDTALNCIETIGEINLSLKIAEDVVMPYNAYEELELVSPLISRSSMQKFDISTQLLKEDDKFECLHSLLDACPNMSLTDVSSVLMRIELVHNRLLPRLVAMCEREVQTCEGDAAILFRQSKLFTKIVELYMRVVGSDYLERSIGRVIRQICEDRVEIEIDPARAPPNVRIGDHVKELERWTAAIWSGIYNARHACPSDMQRLFRMIQQVAEKYFKIEFESGRLSHLSDAERRKVRFTSISAFISLRFFGPAILNPRLFGLCPACPPDAPTQRTLTLIAKVLQGLANMSTFGAKEPWMAAMNPFLQDHWSSFEDYIAHLCAKPASVQEDWTSQAWEPYATPVACRELLAPAIVKEGVPSLPFMIDLPRELAALAALVAQTTSAPEQRQRHLSGSTTHHENGYNQLQEVCQRIDNTARARLRALERRGELGSSGQSQTSHRPIARAESSARSGQRNRGKTVSSRTAHLLAKTLTPPRSSALYASAPTSNGSLSAEDSFASLTISTEGIAKTKRRSHTVSAGSPGSTTTLPDPSRVHHATSPVASPAFSPSSKLREAPFLPTASNVSGETDILEIHLPTSHDRAGSGSISSGSHRRTTISASRPKLTMQLSEPLALLSSVPMPEPRTPRAPLSTAGSSAHSFADMQRDAALAALDGRRKGSGAGIEHELAQADGEPSKTKKGFFGRRK